MKILENAGYKFAVSNALEAFRVRTLLTKEPGTIKWLEELRTGDVFYDIGANIGIYSILAAKAVGESGDVYAVEPHVASAAALLRNAALNNVASRVFLLTQALHSRHDGAVTFNYTHLDPGTSGSQLGHTRSESGEEYVPKAVEIKRAVTVDHLAWLGLRPPCMIKIDVDGNELEILRGMRETMYGSQLRSVQVEVHPNDAGEINQLMAQRGFMISEKHYTALGQQRLDKGVPPQNITHNMIFRRAA